MKFFWVSALIALGQLIVLSLMIKCMNHRKTVPAVLLFLLKLASYYKIIHLLVDNYIKHIIECVCGYAVGLTCGAILLYIVCFFVYPLVIVKLFKLLWNKLLTVPAVKKVWDNTQDKIEGIKHRLGLGNQRGFKVKKVKF